MTYYEKLNIEYFYQKNVSIETNDGRTFNGLLDMHLINDYWEEDGEKEALGLSPIPNPQNIIEAIELDTIKSIELMKQPQATLPTFTTPRHTPTSVVRAGA